MIPTAMAVSMVTGLLNGRIHTDREPNGIFVHQHTANR